MFMCACHNVLQGLPQLCLQARLHISEGKITQKILIRAVLCCCMILFICLFACLIVCLQAQQRNIQNNGSRDSEISIAATVHWCWRIFLIHVKKYNTAIEVLLHKINVDANHQKQQIAHTAAIPMLPKKYEASTASKAPATVKLENARCIQKTATGMSVFISLAAASSSRWRQPSRSRLTWRQQNNSPVHLQNGNIYFSGLLLKTVVF